MKASIALVKEMRNMDFPEDKAREMRALFVAQSLGYHTPLQPGDTAIEHIERSQDLFLKILNEVNEFIPVDTKLATDLFRRIVSARVELMNGVDDTGLLSVALVSNAQEKRVSTEMFSTIKSYCDLPTFAKGQLAASNAVREAFEAK